LQNPDQGKELRHGRLNKGLKGYRSVLRHTRQQDEGYEGPQLDIVFHRTILPFPF
jgi:hypothetical protein